MLVIIQIIVVLVAIRVVYKFFANRLISKGNTKLSAGIFSALVTTAISFTCFILFLPNESTKNFSTNNTGITQRTVSTYSFTYKGKEYSFNPQNPVELKIYNEIIATPEDANVQGENRVYAEGIYADYGISLSNFQDIQKNTNCLALAQEREAVYDQILNSIGSSYDKEHNAYRVYHNGSDAGFPSLYSSPKWKKIYNDNYASRMDESLNQLFQCFYTHAQQLPEHVKRAHPPEKISSYTLK